MLPYVLPVGPSNPSSSAVRRRSIGKPVPVIAQAPSGLRLRARVGRVEPHAVPLELFHDREQVVRHRARLRGLGVGMGGEHVLAAAIGQREQDLPQHHDPLDEREDQFPLLHPVRRHVDVVARAGRVQPAGRLVAARPRDQALHVEEQVFTGPVVPDAADVGDGNPVERGADGTRIVRSDDALFGEHDEVSVVNGHQRREELRLGVLEVLVQDAGDVFGSKGHEARPRLSRFASSLYAPSVPAGSCRQSPRPM